VDPVAPCVPAGADGTFDRRGAGWGGEDFRGNEVLGAEVPGGLCVGWKEGDAGVGSWRERSGAEVRGEDGDVAVAEGREGSCCERRCVGSG
jgi:hypothetical protein